MRVLEGLVEPAPFAFVGFLVAAVFGVISWTVAITGAAAVIVIIALLLASHLLGLVDYRAELEHSYAEPFRQLESKHGEIVGIWNAKRLGQMSRWGRPQSITVALFTDGRLYWTTDMDDLGTEAAINELEAALGLPKSFPKSFLDGEELFEWYPPLDS